MRGEKGKLIPEIKLKSSSSEKGLASILNDHFAAPASAVAASGKSPAGTSTGVSKSPRNPQSNNGSEYVLVDAGDAAEFETLQEKLKLQEGELRRVKEASRAEVVKLNRRNVELEAEICDLKSQLQACSRSSPLTDQLSSLEKSVATMYDRAEIVKRDLSDFEAGRDAAEREKAGLLSRISELESLLSSLEKRAEIAEAALKDMEKPPAVAAPSLPLQVSPSTTAALLERAEQRHTLWRKAAPARERSELLAAELAKAHDRFAQEIDQLTVLLAEKSALLQGKEEQLEDVSRALERTEDELRRTERALHDEEAAARDLRVQMQSEGEQKTVMLERAEVEHRWRMKAMRAEEQLTMVKANMAALQQVSFVREVEAKDPHMNNGLVREVEKLKALLAEKTTLLQARDEQLEDTSRALERTEDELRRTEATLRDEETEAHNLRARIESEGERSTATMLERAEVEHKWRMMSIRAEERLTHANEKMAALQQVSGVREEKTRDLQIKNAPLHAEVDLLKWQIIDMERKTVATVAKASERESAAMLKAALCASALKAAMAPAHEQAPSVPPANPVTDERVALLLQQAEAVLPWQRKAAAAEERLRQVSAELQDLKAAASTLQKLPKALAPQVGVEKAGAKPMPNILRTGEKKARIADDALDLVFKTAVNAKGQAHNLAVQLDRTQEALRRKNDTAASFQQRAASAERAMIELRAESQPRSSSQPPPPLAPIFMPVTAVQMGGPPPALPRSLPSSGKGRSAASHVASEQLALLKMKLKGAKERVMLTSMDTNASSHDTGALREANANVARLTSELSKLEKEEAASKERLEIAIRDKTESVERAVRAEEASALAETLLASVREEKERLAQDVEGLRSLLDEQAILLEAREAALEDAGRSLRRAEQEFRNVEAELRNEQAEAQVLRARVQLTIPLENTIQRKEDDLRSAEAIIMKRVEELQAIEKLLQIKDRELHNCQAVAAAAAMNEKALADQLVRTQAGVAVMSDRHLAETEVLTKQLEELKQMQVGASSLLEHRSEEAQHFKKQLEETMRLKADVERLSQQQAEEIIKLRKELSTMRQIAAAKPPSAASKVEHEQTARDAHHDHLASAALSYPPPGPHIEPDSNKALETELSADPAFPTEDTQPFTEVRRKKGKLRQQTSSSTLSPSPSLTAALPETEKETPEVKPDSASALPPSRTPSPPAPEPRTTEKKSEKKRKAAPPKASSNSVTTASSPSLPEEKSPADVPPPQTAATDMPPVLPATADMPEERTTAGAASPPAMPAGATFSPGTLAGAASSSSIAPPRDKASATKRKGGNSHKRSSAGGGRQSTPSQDAQPRSMTRHGTAAAADHSAIGGEDGALLAPPRMMPSSLWLVLVFLSTVVLPAFLYSSFHA